VLTGTIKTLRPEKGFGFIKDSSGAENVRRTST
jgi:cold shock CspA family protein